MKKLFENLDWGNWLQGLFAAIMSGGSTAVVAAVSISQADPHYLQTITRIFITAAAFCAFCYLKQRPVPDHIVTKTTTILTVEKTVAAPEKPPNGP